MSSAEQQIPAYLNVGFFKFALEYGLHDTDVHIADQQVEDVTKCGENYCSNIYHATIRYSPNEAKDEMEQKYILKVMPLEKQGFLKRLQIYNKEKLFYLELKPRIEALMMLMTDNWRFGARLVYATHQPVETIMFADLCEAGFKHQCRQTGLDEQHARCVLEKLAQYHAATICLAEKEPTIIKHRYPFGLLNVESIKTPPFKLLFGAQLLKLADILIELDEFKVIACKLYEYFEKFQECVLKAVMPVEGAINVLNHGDLWVNNIFFKYDNNNIMETQFIDFQLCFYGSLGFDVNYFLNTSLGLDALQNQRQALIEFYCARLLKCLRQLPVSASAFLTREQILKEIHAREAYGFFVSFAFFPLMSMIAPDSANNTLENLQNAEFARWKINLMFNGNPRTMETLKYSVKRFDDLGIFD